MLIDTSGFFALYSREDINHAHADEIYRKSWRRLTTNYILAEYVALALVRGLPRQESLEFSEAILDDETIEIVWIDENLHIQAVELLQQRSDKSYSLCDAVSFVLMRDRKISEALTTDKHFEQEGFIKLLK